MKKEIKIGDKVLGAISYFHKAQVGIVVHKDMTNIDPLHELIININEKNNIKLDKPEDFNTLSAETQRDLVFVSSYLTMKYSKRIENKYLKLFKLLNTRRGKRYLIFEECIRDFFDSKIFIIRYDLIIFKNIIYEVIYWIFDLFFKAIPELLLGDLYSFYQIRIKIKDLKIEKKKIEKAQYLSKLYLTTVQNQENFKNSINEIENKIEEIKHRKLEISRGFIAITIAFISLILSIKNLSD